MPRGLPGFARGGGFVHDAGMDNVRIRKLIIIAVVVLAALLLPLGLIISGVRGMWKERAEQRAAEAQFSEALRQSLEKAADVLLPAPTLGEGAMAVELPMEKIEDELQRVVRLAAGVGGTASSWNDGETVRVVANVPSSVEVLFRESVERGVYDLNAAGETGPMVMVEVLLKPVAPTKKKAKR
jgi:hypothetical protein